VAESVQIIRKVVVRSIVDDKLRGLLVKEIDDNESALDRDFARFQEQREVYIKQCREKDIKPDFEILKKMAMEEERYKSQKAQLDSRKKHIDGLENGEEFVHGTVDSPVQVSIGDNWHSVMTGIEVVLEDGTVKEIREREVNV
jgi:hypothetical protein